MSASTSDHRHETFSCFLIGSESLLIPCCELLREKGHRVLGVISDNADIRAWAEGVEVEFLDAEKPYVDALARQPFDYLFSVAWLRLLPLDVFDLPTRGAINFHDGPLPEYAGLNTPVWGILRGESEWGVTWHRMTEGVDEGEILKARRFPIADDETSIALNTKCYENAIASFGELADEIASGTVESREQDFSERQVFSRKDRPEAACCVSWESSASAISTLCRALDFGGYANPVGLPKIVAGSRLVGFTKATIVDASDASSSAPGTVVDVEDSRLCVATSDGDVWLEDFVDPSVLAEVERGQVLEELSETRRGALSEIDARTAASEPFWSRRLQGSQPLELPFRRAAASDDDVEASFETVRVDLATEALGTLDRKVASGSLGDIAVLAQAAYFGRVSSKVSIDVDLFDAAIHADFDVEPSAFATTVPLRFELDPESPSSELLTEAHRALNETRKHKTFLRDLAARTPMLRARASGGASTPLVVFERTTSLSGDSATPRGELVVRVADDGSCEWEFDTNRFSTESIENFATRVVEFVDGLAQSLDAPLLDVSLLGKSEADTVLREWNATAVDYPREHCMHTFFEEQVAQQPDRTALVWREERISYRELDEASNQLARYLIDLGVGAESLVGVSVERSPRLLIGLLAVLKAGGAYVPLDPDYPEDRLAFMVEDSGLRIVLSESSVCDRLPSFGGTTVLLDESPSALTSLSIARPAVEVAADNLAYVIYTSGSTGKPKGVLVTHRNAANFFAGMDERIPPAPEGKPGTWLAVTSLSFDISVLELFWTLGRGFEVVLYSESKLDEEDTAHVRGAAPHDFSLFYFASDAGREKDRYQLLLEGAKFADENDFCAVWTPERHFHAFGGLYPNPSVVSAAIAATTKNVGIRAGSCVSPLHHPVRVAEEWSVVDNLSNGRVGISFAAGWQPNDFVIRPDSFADRKNVMFRDIEVVKKLWRGEKVAFPDSKGESIEVSTFPRPIQKELPVWVTVAGNPETFRQAGEIGAHLLTHLLGQSLEELDEKVGIYRKAWREAGHPGQGIVTLMLHTFVGETEEHARDTVREPLKSYLKSAVHLIKQAAWSFPTFKQRAEFEGTDPGGLFDSLELGDEDMDALLEHAFLRYYETSGLFGTVEQCVEFAEKVGTVDVDEISCLIDFGIDPETVLRSLDRLKKVLDWCRTRAQQARGEVPYSIPSLIERHEVTHFQCTPSMAGMLLADRATREALSTIDAFLVGGEALSKALADDLCALGEVAIVNMYGPTETTIWSSTHRLDSNESTVPIGTPIANTGLYILDAWKQPVPVGVPGELWIGGDGVTRGYHQRPELTDERFIPDRFGSRSDGRLYRTGDLVWFREDGVIEFIGRLDHQVKVRGYRIELGEIEARMRDQGEIAEAVVVAREDVPGDKRLVGYFLTEKGQYIDDATLRTRLHENLPEYMVPTNIVALDSFPLTPNGKIDRKALPAPSEVKTAAKVEYEAPTNEVEEQIAEVWQEVLMVDRVGVDDNFFELGGHSLLAVKAHRVFVERVAPALSITDLFRFPTVRTLSAHLADGGQGAVDMRSEERASTRREAMARRRDRRRSRKPVR